MSADDLLYAPVSGRQSSPANIRIEPFLRLPESWIEIVNKLRGYNSNWQETALAGGALRDLDLGRPIKDVDIFLPAWGGPVTCTDIDICLNRNVMRDVVDIIEIQHDPAHNSALTNGVHVPSHFMFYLDGWKFEITQKMETFTQRSIIDSFDLGICMICLEGSTVYRSPEYLHDVANKHITVVQQTGGREVSHAKRIHRKYADWTIIP